MVELGSKAIFGDLPKNDCVSRSIPKKTSFLIENIEKSFSDGEKLDDTSMKSRFTYFTGKTLEADAGKKESFKLVVLSVVMN